MTEENDGYQLDVIIDSISYIRYTRYIIYAKKNFYGLLYTIQYEIIHCNEWFSFYYYYAWRIGYVSLFLSDIENNIGTLKG